MNENKETESKKLTDPEEKEINRMLEPIKEQNPDISVEEIEELKKMLKELIKSNKKNIKITDCLKKLLRGFIVYIVSSLSVLGFFFTYLSIEDKLIILLIPTVLSLVLSMYEVIKYIQFMKKPIVLSIKPYIYELIIICLLGFIINEFINVFQHNIIGSIYIVIVFIMKMLVNSLLNKTMYKKVVVGRRDKDV